MSGQLKTLLDHANPLYGGDYHFAGMYMITCTAEDEPETPSQSIAGLCGWIDCFERVSLKGTVFGGGVNVPDEIQSHKALRDAYELGKSIKQKVYSSLVLRAPGA